MAKQPTIDLPKELKNKCYLIIHGASAACAGTSAASAQIPLADTVVITPIQIGMIAALGKVFDREITKTAARAIISGAGASLIGRGVSQVLVGWIPGFGNALNAATSAGLTEAIGWLAVDQFAKEYVSSGKSLSDIDADAIVVPDKYDERGAKDDSSQKSDASGDPMTLEDRLQEFLDGTKTKADNRDEFNALLEEVENALESRPDDDPLFEKYHNFVRVK